MNALTVEILDSMMMIVGDAAMYSSPWDWGLVVNPLSTINHRSKCENFPFTGHLPISSLLPGWACTVKRAGPMLGLLHLNIRKYFILQSVHYFWQRISRVIIVDGILRLTIIPNLFLVKKTFFCTCWWMLCLWLCWQVNNYALRMHLNQAQQYNPFPGRFPPDAF